MPHKRLALVIMFASGCPGEGAGGWSDPDASGSLKLQREGGELRLDFDGCWSGQLLSFYGVDLFDDPDLAKRVRVVDDAVHGKQVVLLGVVPDRARVALDASHCSTFDVRIEPTNNYLNDVRVLGGSLKLECTLPEDGGTLSATALLNDCSFDNRAANP